jgi:transketolase
MAEGSVWEACELASHYNLDNLIAIVDVNRLGQRGETMLGHHTEVYADRARAFGWHAIVIDGHDCEQIDRAYAEARAHGGQPVMIVARTQKGPRRFANGRQGKLSRQGVSRRRRRNRPARDRPRRTA